MDRRESPSPVDAELLEKVFAALESRCPAEAVALGQALGVPESIARSALDSLARYEQALTLERSRVESSEASGGRSLPSGTRLGDFVLGEVLGCGAMGVVYRARQVSLGDREVALKVLHTELAARDRRFVERFRREAELAATVHHPHLAEVYGFEELDGTLCFAMRLIEGPTLGQVLARLAWLQDDAVRPSSTQHVEAVARLVRTLAGALAAIHGAGMVHRDVKPSNVLLEGAPESGAEALTAQPILVDFGLLRPVTASDLTGTRTVIGTPSYASPEARLGRHPDARTDVFSLGATMHDLLTVTAPGSRAPATSGMPDVRRVNPTVDERLAAVIRMALQDRPELRYADAGALRDDLDRYLRGEPVRARPESPLGRLRLWRRRNPAQAARAVSLAIVGLVLLALATWTTQLAWELDAVAAAAIRAERTGDLATAARNYRTLAEAQGAWLLPWRVAARARAAEFRGAPENLRLALEHLASADRLRTDGPAAAETAEIAFARACDRVCNLLFGDHAEEYRDVLLRFLAGEARAGSTSYRQTLALDALTNYLGLQERGQWVPEGLARMLQAKILEPVEDAGARQVRRAAVAAYGAIREVGVFADLIALLDDDDPEVARLAKACTRTMYGWLRMPSRAPPRIDRSVMEAWAIAIARQAERYSSRTFGLRESKFSATRLGTWPWSREIAWCLACWEQDPLDPTAPARRLGLPEDLRAELELQHAALADFVDSPGVNVESSEDDADMSTDRFLYRQATGRAVALHDSEVWRDPRPEAQGSAHGPGDAAPTGRVDFTCESGGEPLVEPAGTIEAVFWEAARHVPGDALSDGTRLPPYLRFAHPGKSRLTIRSVIPDEAIALEVAIRHHIGTRDNLRDRGSVTLRLSVSGTSTRSVFPGPRPYSWPVGIDPGEPESIVHLQFDDLSARRSLELVLEELHGNTTHRIDRIDLRWRLN